MILFTNSYLKRIVLGNRCITVIFNLKLSSITRSDVLPVDVEIIVSVRPVLFVEEAEGVSEFVDDGPFEDASRSQGDGLLTTIDHANVGVAPESKAKN